MYMDASQMGKKGARITNKILTTEMRRKAAVKGWELRWERMGTKRKGKKKVK